ncbi:RelA/SpoT domain-containing protein [Corallococcus exiguus]|uniref:RelA/SpoT domain-containing protein n=1 Tax=Corallococcus exiguus TaxID=83462 RepID=UPI001494F8C7|nr:RelA/SpoT domain-containing protein [Corallococcus exiguus]
MAPRAPSPKHLENVISTYRTRRDDIDLFRKQVVSFFETSRQFHTQPLPLIHSIKSRLKDEAHLKDKIKRKWKTKKIGPLNLLRSVTDLAGVRILHLYTEQFSEIHKAIQNHINRGFWILAEAPIAYSWDPEATKYFQSLGLKAVTRDSYYTSIHYVVKPHFKTDLACEIQVRTLFEEAWGEIDHALNYPTETTLVACKEQLRVLAKLTSTGTRLADSIFRISRSKQPSSK